MAITSNLVMFTQSGIYVPSSPNVVSIEILARAAGGGGTSGVSHPSTASSRKCGAGGGGGGISVTFRRLPVGELAMPLTVTVGKGGAGGGVSASSGGWNAGQDGGDSIVTDANGDWVVWARGGGGATDWQIAGPGGGSGYFRGGDGGVNGAWGGTPSGAPIRSITGGGGGGSGGGYMANGNVAGSFEQGNYLGGGAGLVPRPAKTFGLDGSTPWLWQWCQSGTGGNGGEMNGAGGKGGFPSGGGGGGGGGNPGGAGGAGADGAVAILEWTGDII